MNYPQYPLLSGALINSVTGLLHNRIMTSNKQEYLSLNIRTPKTILHLGQRCPNGKLMVLGVTIGCIRVNIRNMFHEHFAFIKVDLAVCLCVGKYLGNYEK